MSDNSTQGGSDTVRDIDRGGLGVKTQVVQIDFGGASGNTEQLATLANPLPTAQSQTSFFFSTGNSSTAQLAPGAVFPGVFDNVISQNALSLLIESDQPVTVVINQYITNTDTVASSSETYVSVPTLGGWGISKAVNLNGNYVQLAVTNNGVVATTKLNVNTYYGTIPQTAQVIGTLNQVTGQVDTAENGDNANDMDLPSSANSNVPTSQATGLLSSETYAKVFDGVMWQRQRGQIDQGTRVYDTAVIELLTQVLAELRVHSVLMQQAFSIGDNLDAIRNDQSINLQ